MDIRIKENRQVSAGRRAEFLLFSENMLNWLISASHHAHGCLTLVNVGISVFRVKFSACGLSPFSAILNVTVYSLPLLASSCLDDVPFLFQRCSERIG